MNKLFYFFVTISFLQGCKEASNESLTLGEIWSWFFSGLELLYTGNWELITAGQAVAIIIFHLVGAAILRSILKPFAS